MLTAELLDVYRQDIVALQAQCASATLAPPLASIRHHLAPWQVTHLQPLHELAADEASRLSLCGHWTLKLVYAASLIHTSLLMQALLPPLHHMLFQHDFTGDGGGTSSPAAAAAAKTDAAPAGGRLPDGTRLFAAVCSAAAGCGAPPLASTLQRLAWHANQTLFRQLSSWCGCSAYTYAGLQPGAC